jgi:hypothetical protein
MARKLRIQFPGAIYHLMNRGDHGTELRESAEAEAERLIQEALRNQPAAQEQLLAWRKAHPFKLALAKKLREETTVTLEWIAQRLSMGSRGYLAQLLIDENQTAGANKTPQPELGI